MSGKIEVATPRSVSAAAPRLEEQPKATTAIIVFHGMGQQVPFETLDALARQIQRRGLAKVRLVHDGQGTLPVAEIVAEKVEKGTKQTKPVHLYEAYWAPLMEGRVTLYEAARFLFGAGLLGLRHCFPKRTFRRWMFGDYQSLPIPARTAVSLWIAFLVLLSLAVILGSVVALAYSWAMELAGRAGLAMSFQPGIKTALVATAADVIAIALALIGIPSLLNRYAPWKGWQYVTQGGAALVLLTVIREAISITFSVFDVALKGALLPLRIVPASLLDWKPVEIGSIGLLLVAAWVVRRFLLQSVGDVAAYVSAHKLNRFYEVREAVKGTAFRVASAVYRSSNPKYEKIILVGHSLGSVVAYDTLNALIVNDSIAGSASLGVLSRTKTLLTFGSPLDKTAFIFRTQVKDAEFREALAAAKQPLILDYANRTMKWINIHSQHDWISGRLDFYDLPGNVGQNGVDNRADAESVVPMKAHTDYWSHEELKKALEEAIW